MKKIMAFMLSICMLFGCISAYADVSSGVTVKFERNMDNKTVTISGTGLSSNEIILVKIEDANDKTAEAYIPITGLNDGSYSVTFTADEAVMDSGVKNIVLKRQSLAAEILLENEVYYSADSIDGLISGWNSADSTDDISTLITGTVGKTNVGILLNTGLSDRMVDEIGTPSTSEGKWKELCDSFWNMSEAEKVSDISTSFGKNYITYAVNNAVADDADNDFEVDLLREFAEVFISAGNEVYDNEFAYMSDTDKESVYKIAVAEIKSSAGYARTVGYITAEAITNALYDAVLTASLKSKTAYNEIKPFVDKYNTYFNVDFTGYSSVQDIPALDAAIIAEKESYTSTSTLKSLYEGLIAAAPKKSSQSGTGGGSGGGGGGGGSSFVTSTPNISITTDKEILNQEIEEIIFDDLTGYEWAEADIMKLYNSGGVDGVGNNKFAPNRVVTREEFVKLVLSLLEETEVDVTDCEFSDAEKDAWYYSYLSKAKNAGVVSGRNDGTFGVGDYVTREDMAVMCLNALSIKKASLLANQAVGIISFADTNSISSYAWYAVSSLTKLNVLKGFEDNTFRPHGYATRAEAAVVVSRILGL